MLRRAKLLIISGAFPPAAGPETAHTLCLADAFSAEGIETHLLIRASGDPKTTGDFTVHREMRGWRWRDLPTLLRCLRKCQPNAILLIYHDWPFQYHSLMTFAPTFAHWLLPGVPFVTLFENTFAARGTSITASAIREIFRRLLGRDTDGSFGTLLRDSDHLVFLSEAHRRTLCALHPPAETRSHVIPIPPLIRSRYPHGCPPTADERTFTMIHFGYMYAGKGMETLLAAMKLLQTRGFTARLIIAGGALIDSSRDTTRYVQEMHTLSEQLGLRSVVEWVGFQPESALSAMLQAAHLCVLPFDEGIAMNNSSVALAASHRLPILATQGRELDSAFQSGENVWLVPPRNPEALADAMAKLAADSTALENLRGGSRALAEEFFSWRKTVDRMRALFTSAAKVSA